MSFYPVVEGEFLEVLDAGWRMSSSPAGQCALPADAATLATIAAQVPGTVAGALARAGQLDRAAPQKLHDKDFWFFREISGKGRRLLRLDGLATLAEVYLDDKLLIQSSNMFHAHEVELELEGTHRLAIVFRALTSAFATTKPRARWRVQMVPNQGTRFVRTTLLGQMPGWCPSIEAVGPWRGVNLVTPAPIIVENVQIISMLDGADGELDVILRLVGAIDPILPSSPILHCDGVHVEMHPNAEGLYFAHLSVPNVQPWWPHTHGEPVLYPVYIEASGIKIDLGQTGFRKIQINRGRDGKDFAVYCNHERIFCRGAVWTNTDIVNLPGGRADYEPWLKQARDAGMNMIRIGGTMTYETRAFFELCSELGLMVWAEYMFANFDYPTAITDFAASCTREAGDFLRSTQGQPSLAILCGGSEMLQQAAMMGLPTANWGQDLTTHLLREVSNALRQDVPYVVNSPSGGPLPFAPNEGLSHYYGVGAYERPLEDSRRANVRFAAECLAFANVPEQATLDAYLPVAPLHHPRWKAAVPRDLSASWDFEDTREFYFKLLYGVEPAQLRRENAALWLNASRAVSAEVMEATFAEWRRVGSSCNGALVWTLQDLVPGAGWGVIDSTGRAKPAFFGLKRALRPQQILFSDEGTSGLHVHCINERPVELLARIEILCLQNGAQAVIRREHVINLPPRGRASDAIADLIGGFFDTTYAFRFGPPGHDVSVARMFDHNSGELLAEAFHFPLGRSLSRQKVEFSGVILRDENGWMLELETAEFLQSVHIDCAEFVPEDNWFHLAPGVRRKIRLAGGDHAPQMDISALNTSYTLHLAG